MRIFLIEWYNDRKDFVDVALELEKRGHEIVYWEGNDKQIFEINRQQFKNAIFHLYKDAGECVPPKEFENVEFAPLGRDFIKHFFETESVVLTMFRREQRQRMPVMEMKRIFYKYLQCGYGVIQKLKPDVVIFMNWPHGGYDFVIYALAKFLKIKTLIIEYTRVSDRLLISNDLRKVSDRLREEVERNRGKQWTVEDLSPDIQKVYAEHSISGAVNAPLGTKIFYKKHTGKNLLFIKLKMILKAISDFSIFKKIIVYFFKKFKPNPEKEYVKLQSKPDFNEKFVYVALQYQPECSTSPRGGVFVDQILAIEILSASVPDDWFIYVKEHPIRRMRDGLHFTSYCYESYYRRIAEIKKVKLIPIGTDLFKLINESQAVATMTGSVGRQAVLRLKPAMIFGYPWYQDCAGIFKINDVASCKEAIEKIRGGFTINKQDIINYLYSLDKATFHGYFDEAGRIQSSLKGEAHTRSIFNALITEIEGKISENNA